MKKNDWFLLAAVASFSGLFYDQSAGLNFFLFTCMLLALLYLQTGAEVRGHWSWRLTAGAAFLTGLNVLVVNSDLALFMNLVSLVLVAGFSLSPRSSIFVAAFNSLSSVSGAFLDSFFRKQASDGTAEPDVPGGVLVLAGLHRQHLMMVGVPVGVCLVFLWVYASASQAFSHVLSFIRLDFLSWGWALFTFFGFVVLYGFFRQRIFAEGFTDWDLETGNSLLRRRLSARGTFKLPALRYEYRTSYLLLVMLNLLLVAFILSDAYYLTLGTLPASINYTDFLHQGVNALILSILLAIAVLLVVFRGNLNFYRGNRGLKQLAYLWLALNLVLVLLTLYKNSVYVYTTGLTYKRTGVYMYLTLTIIGLVYSYLKVANLKNNWYLFRKNAWALYLVLLVFSSYSWDRVITHFNLHVAQSIDTEYLFRLSDDNLAELAALTKNPKVILKEDQKVNLAQRIFYFQQHQAEKEWPSWNLNDWRVEQNLKALELWETNYETR